MLPFPHVAVVFPSFPVFEVNSLLAPSSTVRSNEFDIVDLIVAAHTQPGWGGAAGTVPDQPYTYTPTIAADPRFVADWIVNFDGALNVNSVGQLNVYARTINPANPNNALPQFLARRYLVTGGAVGVTDENQPPTISGFGNAHGSIRLRWRFVQFEYIHGGIGAARQVRVAVYLRPI